MSPAVVAVIEESRVLINNPFENTWWVPGVLDHSTRHAQQIAVDIEARNAGYAVLRRPGERDERH